jgi:hypothetical protein
MSTTHPPGPDGRAERARACLAVVLTVPGGQEVKP